MDGEREVGSEACTGQVRNERRVTKAPGFALTQHNRVMYQRAVHCRQITSGLLGRGDALFGDF